MGADRARLTFVPSRQYREVVTQQGRVTLEADVNEASRIASEALRLETIDVVGPVGTPDNGYEVTPVAGGTSLDIGQGTMYVGGLRFTLPDTLRQTRQTDWLDTATDPLWLPQRMVNGNAALVLLAQEQEITAVEDPALIETALGGPDTAARTRFLQRFPLIPVSGTTCAAAEKDLDTFWAALGRDLDSATATLQPRSRLQVTTLSTPPAASPCDPPAQTGYLGADNQLIRVQITRFDPATRTGRLLWGFNNASTLYRCKLLDDVTLQLSSRPIAPEFTPTSGQVVQLLMPTADLGEGALAAALGGHVATLTTAYQPDPPTIILPGPVPAAYMTPASAVRFVRLWKEDLAFTLGAPVTLTDTGLAVTITAATGNAVSVNDYWCFSVRPLTPNVVYPERLMTTPQPPDGPRQFLGPLAVLSRANEQWTRRDDCRLPFDDLVELTARKPGTSDGCCVSVKPAQAADLQSIIDGLAHSGVMGATIHLEPGIYELPTPLVFTSRHRGLVLASCSGVPVVLRAAKDALSRFGLGMIILEQAAGVTLRGLELQVPVAPLPPGMVDAMRKQPSLAKAEMAGVSIGIHVAGRPVGSTASPIALPRVTIEACLFAFDATQAIFGAGVFGRDNLPNLRVRDCRFAAALKDGARAPLIAGVMIVPVYVPELDLLVAPRLPESTLTENTFTGLSFGMLVAGQIGDVTACGNTVSGGFCGLGLITLPALLRNWDELNTIPPGENASDPGFATVQACHRAFLDNVQVVLGVGLGASVPRPVALAAATQSPAALTLRLTATANRLDVTGSQVAVPSDTSFKSGRSGLMGLSAGVGDITGPAFYLWSAPNPLPSFATITGNTCVNRSNRTPAMMVLMIEQLAITGNLLNNLAKDNTSNTGRYALIVVPGGRISSTDFEVQVNLFAVTGNSMLGRSNLHLWVRKEWEARLSAMKLPIAAWDFFNTEA